MPDTPANIKKFERIALRYQPNNLRAVDASIVLLAYLRGKNIDVEIMHADLEAVTVSPPNPDEIKKLEKLDLMISLGGDGTFLSSSRLASMYDIPVFGINMGGLGFLTEVTIDNALKGMDQVLKGDFHIEERIMIETELENENVVHTYTALNDIVFHRISLHKIVAIEVFINEHPVVSYEADGIIISTPTGSTAYSLSSGGSILWPDLSALIITPICPHSLSSRPLIVPADKIIKLSCPTAYKSEISVMLDGQVSCRYNYPISFEVRKSDTTAKLVRISGKQFGRTLREKLGWGKRFRQ
ncbi:MAG: NAD(+)/NADH kinase [bacterium]